MQVCGDTEVGEQCLFGFHAGEQNVRGFDVAMHDAGAVRVVQRAGDVDKNLYRTFEFDCTGT